MVYIIIIMGINTPDLGLRTKNKEKVYYKWTLEIHI